MKVLALLTALIGIAYLLGFTRRMDCSDWMGRNFTTVIKGFAILTVVWAHTGAHFGVGGIQFIAGTGVALFLICSGYGLECSYQKNGLKQFISKRFLRVCIPFWIVEFFGLLVTGELTLQEYFKNALFIDCTWYLQFIMICYILFFCIKVFCEKLNLQKQHEWILWGICTVVWFIIESCFLADASMPFLRARQMLSFPLGIVIAQNKNAILEFMNREKKTLLTYMVGGIACCLIFMVITQLSAIKAQSFIIQNVLSLLTCLPLALSVLLVGYLIPMLFESALLYWTGIVSYEVFLIHTFVLNNLGKSVWTVFILIAVTSVCAVALHLLLQRGLYSHGRFNRRNTFEK